MGVDYTNTAPALALLDAVRDYLHHDDQRKIIESTLSKYEQQAKASMEAHKRFVCTMAAESKARFQFGQCFGVAVLCFCSSWG